jgi:Tfp pilus assembly protein PilX
MQIRVPNLLRRSFRSILKSKFARRGAAGLACLVLLVFTQLLIVGAILSGSREQDTSVQRLDTTRAFYAAEGAMNMAIREVMSNTDEDGDGGVGTISDTGVLEDDPPVGSGRAYVVQSTSGGVITMVSRGRSGAARRQITTDID